MATGDFTKEEAKETTDAVKEMFEAIPKSKRMEYLGHYNDILCFIDSASKHALNIRQVKPTTTKET